MNKKIVLFGAAALVALSALTAFREPKTVAEQMKMVEEAVTARITEFKATKDQECTAKVTAEAQSRFSAEMAKPAPATPTPAIKAPTKKPSKPTSKGGPKVDPLPQPTPPAPAKPETPNRGGATSAPATKDDVFKRGGATTAPAKKDEVFKRGGATKTPPPTPPTGGGN